MRAIVVHPMADSVSADQISGGTGLAACGCIRLLQELGHEVTTIIQPKHRTLRYPEGLKTEMVVRNDVAEYVNQINWSQYDLAVLVGLVSPLYTKINIPEIPVPLIIQLEEAPRLAKRLHQQMTNRDNVVFFGDRQGIAYSDGIPLSRFTAMPVVLDFYGSDPVAPSVNRLFYAGKISKDNSIETISKYFGDSVDYYGRIVQNQYKQWCGDNYQGAHNPKTFYRDTACKYLGAVRASDELGIPHENVEAMLAGVPVVVLNDEVWNSYDADSIYGSVEEADGRFRTCAISGYGFSPMELLAALQAYTSVEKRQKIREHAKTMTLEANGYKMREMINRVTGKGAARPPVQPVQAAPPHTPVTGNGGGSFGASNASVEDDYDEEDSDTADTMAQLAEEAPENPAE